MYIKGLESFLTYCLFDIMLKQKWQMLEIGGRSGIGVFISCITFFE